MRNLGTMQGDEVWTTRRRDREYPSAWQPACEANGGPCAKQRELDAGAMAEWLPARSFLVHSS